MFAIVGLGIIFKQVRAPKKQDHEVRNPFRCGGHRLRAAPVFVKV